jgi:periplasmic copper chaperone A
MEHMRHRRRLLGAGLSTGLVWVGSSWLAPAQACEVQAEFLRITHPWTRATAPDADFAVLCMRFDEVTGDDRLIAVHTPVAEGAEMGGSLRGQAVDVPIAAGSTLDLHEHGVHLRLTPLRHAIHVGRSYPLRLTFARSGVVHATLSVDYTRFS